MVTWRHHQPQPPKQRPPLQRERLQGTKAADGGSAAPSEHAARTASFEPAAASCRFSHMIQGMERKYATLRPMHQLAKRGDGTGGGLKRKRKEVRAEEEDQPRKRTDGSEAAGAGGADAEVLSTHTFQPAAAAIDAAAAVAAAAPTKAAVAGTHASAAAGGGAECGEGCQDEGDGFSEEGSASNASWCVTPCRHRVYQPPPMDMAPPPSWSCNGCHVRYDLNDDFIDDSELVEEAEEEVEEGGGAGVEQGGEAGCEEAGPTLAGGGGGGGGGGSGTCGSHPDRSIHRCDLLRVYH